MSTIDNNGNGNEQPEVPPLVVRLDCPNLPQETRDHLQGKADEWGKAILGTGWLSDRVSEVAFTDDLPRAVAEIATDWGTADSSVTRDRGVGGVAKTMRRDDGSESVLVFSAALLLMPEGVQVLYGQVLMEAFHDELPDELRNITGQHSGTPLAELLRQSLSEWVPRIQAFEVLKKLNLLKIDESNVSSLLHEFRRKIKSIQYAYQSNNDVHRLRLHSIGAVSSLVTRAIEAHITGNPFDGNGDLGDSLKKLVATVVTVAEDIRNQREYDVEPIDQGFRDFLVPCSMKLDPMEAGKRYSDLTITADPKLLFRSEIVETEDRFVGFLDILGFAAMIEDHDTNPESNVLRFLKDALESAVRQATVRAEQGGAAVRQWGVGGFFENFNEVLDYRMFSDCFCLSLPYFDNNKDYSIQAASMITMIRIFTANLMTEGILIRGGLASGSYYSDEHVIFSGGLVAAYKIEKHIARHLRVVVDTSIVDRLKRNSLMFNHMLGLTEALVLDTQDQQVFINPFGLDRKIPISLKDAANQMDALYEELGISNASNTFLRNLAKSLVGIAPQIGSIAFDMAPPSEIESSIPQFDSQEFIASLEKPVVSMRKQVHDGNTGQAGILLKYEWLLDFARWWSGTEDSQRFAYVLAPPTSRCV